jgi:DNA-3-methyladenine glycosylase I
MSPKLERCWKTSDPLHISYHDKEWGVPLHDDNKFFEFLVLGGFQAGLTWWLILSRRELFRQAFDCFIPKRVASYGVDDVERLMSAPGIIHNKMKIMAAINNAQRFLEVQSEFGSFDSFIWTFVNGTIHNSFSTLADLPSETEDSKRMSKELRKRGFKFVGPTICYAFMQATGLVNDHLVSCFRSKELNDLRS